MCSILLRSLKVQAMTLNDLWITFQVL